jgi:hypothetical protein
MNDAERTSGERSVFALVVLVGCVRSEAAIGPDPTPSRPHGDASATVAPVGTNYVCVGDNRALWPWDQTWDCGCQVESGLRPLADGESSRSCL